MLFEVIILAAGVKNTIVVLKCDSFISHSDCEHGKNVSPKTRFGSIVESTATYKAVPVSLPISFSLSGVRIGSCWETLVTVTD